MEGDGQAGRRGGENRFLCCLRQVLFIFFKIKVYKKEGQGEKAEFTSLVRLHLGAK